MSLQLLLQVQELKARAVFRCMRGPTGMTKQGRSSGIRTA